MCRMNITRKIREKTLHHKPSPLTHATIPCGRERPNLSDGWFVCLFVRLVRERQVMLLMVEIGRMHL